MQKAEEQIRIYRELTGESVEDRAGGKQRLHARLVKYGCSVQRELPMVRLLRFEEQARNDR
jgi:hypothetical protein